MPGFLSSGAMTDSSKHSGWCKVTNSEFTCLISVSFCTGLYRGTVGFSVPNPAKGPILGGNCRAGSQGC